MNSRFEQGAFCPACLCVYRSDAGDEPMTQCPACQRWVHDTCEDACAPQTQGTEPAARKTDLTGPERPCLVCRAVVADRCPRFHARFLATSA